MNVSMAQKNTPTHVVDGAPPSDYHSEQHTSTKHDEKAILEPPTTEIASEQLTEATIVAKEDYSVFSVAQKRSIILAGSFAAWFSPMSGAIYFPALDKIASDLGVSNSRIAITVTTYLIIQGLAPMMIAGFSDKAGRRPAYFLCFSVFIVANLALALQSNYVGLLVLRMLQSAGSSGTVALANGMVGDLITSSERGSYIAWASLGSILGPTLSPILGGLLSRYLDWHWIFWFLLILSCVFYVPFFLFLPETSRNIVGDGSVPPPWTSWNISDTVRHRNRTKNGVAVDETKMLELRKNYRISIPNPVSTLRILADLEAALLLLTMGLAIACYYAVSTGASSAFSSLYGLDELHVSLCFLSIGGGSLISAFTTGKLVDCNYRRQARKLDFPITKNRQTDLSTFPIERARLQLSIPCLIVGGLSIIVYGFLMDHKLSLAGPITMLFSFGYCLIAGFQVLNVLLVDIYPGHPAAVTAAANLVRCLLGAGASAAIVPMSNAMGHGWAYTTLALIFLLSCLGPLLCIRYGMRWRQEKKEKRARRAKNVTEKDAPRCI